jgi:hypothetical protein
LGKPIFAVVGDEIVGNISENEHFSLPIEDLAHSTGGHDSGLMMVGSGKTKIPVGGNS